MTPFSNDNVYPISLERFVQISNEPGLLQFLSEQSQLAKREVSDRVEDERYVSWTVTLDIGDQAPGALKKLFGGQDLKWVQTFKWDKQTNITKIGLDKSLIQRFFDVDAEVSLIRKGPLETILHFKGKLISKMPLGKKAMERYLLEKILVGWDEDAATRLEYIKLRMKELEAAGALSAEECLE